jgi:hypothetical protein
MTTTIELEARERIDDRLRHAAAPHLPAARRRTSIARQLRKIADKLDN